MNRFTKNIGMLLLAIWLILSGLAAFIPALGGLGVVLAILAIAAGIFILLAVRFDHSRSTATRSTDQVASNKSLEHSKGAISCCGLSL